MQAQRNVLYNKKPGSSPHAGLWLDKFLTDQTEEGKKDEKASQAKAKLIKELCDIKVPDGYQAAFARRESLFTDLKVKKLANYCAATVDCRIIIGLGQKGSAEAGLALEHTWGVPIIPGSALKGLTMAAAHLLLEDERWRKNADKRGDSLALLGGTTEHIGNVIFHDAWWIPEQEKLPIQPDVMTVHHPDYYKDGGKAPSDMDSPIPIPFASVTGKYLVVVESTFPLKAEEQKDLLEAALYILKLGLAHLGIGAKTNAGYGRMTLDFECEAERMQREAEERAARERKAQQQRELVLRDAQGKLKNVNDGNAPQLVPAILASIADDGARAEWARQAVQKLEPKKVRRKASEQKQWAIELLKAAERGD